MKIYQVIEYGGEYEDRYERVLKTYLSKERALEYKELLQKKFEENEELSKKCFYGCKVKYWTTDSNYGLIQEIEDDCINADLFIESDGEEKWLSCSNDYSEYEYREVYGYRVVEYEVEDGE